MIHNRHYNDKDLAGFLRGYEGDLQDIQDHVETCEACQNRLEQLSQNGLSWKEITALLSPVADPIVGKTESPEFGEPHSADCGDISFLSPTDYEGSLGRFARYEILEILGRGGMGIVMRGFDTSLNRHSAIKVLAPALASSAASRQRFSREAKSAAAVVHPHVVPIQTVDEHAGLPFLVMPVIEGKSVENRVQQSGPLGIMETIRIAAQVADGLQAAHEQGLVHRDIKPGNVLLENGVERVQITDFGLARAIDDASMTRSGVIAGTPQYMSPEQAHGDSIDHRSDLFSLGSLIYFMLTGRSPFRAETTMGVLNRIGNERPRTLRSINSDVPEWLDSIVAQLLEKDPNKRYQTAGEVSELLDQWHAHLHQPEQIPPPDSLLRRSAKPNTGVKILLATITCCALLLLALYSSQGIGTPDNSSVGSNLRSVSNGDGTHLNDLNVEQADDKPLKGLQKDQTEIWRSPLGTSSIRAPVIHGDHIYVGSNNANAYIKRFPSSVDLGVLLCFRKSDGKFLWQHSNRKLESGRIHDWPQLGITSRPCVAEDRLYYVTNCAEVVCLDTKGFYDGENDGAVQDESRGGKEADVVWRLDMMKELGVQPHNVSTCTVVKWKDRIFVVTGNGVGVSHRPPLAKAPSFIALHAKSGKVLWQDDSPGQNILHGQWGSPTVIEVNGEPQVVMPGGDGWLYSFDPYGTMHGQSKLIWKFDCNAKETKWKLGGLGTRNNLIHGPTFYDGLLYITTGQDPEHGSGAGKLICIDPTGKGDVSTHIVFNKNAPDRPVPHRREQACVEENGEFVKPNPNSKSIWQFENEDVNGNGQLEIEEKMWRSLSTIAIKENLLFVSDTEGILHCIDRRTGKQQWGFDTFANVYSTPVIVGNKVYLGTVDGEVLVFSCSADLEVAAPGGKPVQRIEFGSSVNASVVEDQNVLYFTTNRQLIAVKNSDE